MEHSGCGAFQADNDLDTKSDTTVDLETKGAQRTEEASESDAKILAMDGTVLAAG